MEKYRKLKARIIEKYGTQENFLKYSKINKTTFISRMKGRTFFNLAEIKELCNMLEISTNEVIEYFFQRKVKFSLLFDKYLFYEYCYDAKQKKEVDT